MSDSESSSCDEQLEDLESCGPGVEAPKDLMFDSMVVDLVFHPNREVLASGTMDGDIFLHSYKTGGDNNQLMKLTHHTKPCRGLAFSEDGKLLFSVSKDKSLQAVDMETGSVTYKIEKAHKVPIYSLCLIDSYLAATGDDEGNFKVWDYRRQDAIMECKNCEEYISALEIDRDKRIVLATSGEGTLTAFNIRKKQMELQSELFDAEFLCLAVVKRGRKVVVGTGDGVLNIFNWGEWGNMSDRFPGHPISVDCMVQVRNDIVCTGSIDGVIRAVNILPNRFLGMVGKHEEFPIECLSVTTDGNLLASCSHDQKVKFWNISCLDNVEADPQAKPEHRSASKSLPSSKQQSFFADLAE